MIVQPHPPGNGCLIQVWAEGADWEAAGYNAIAASSLHVGNVPWET